MTQHAYLPTRTISDKGSVFLSQVIKSVSDLQGITLEKVTTKQAQAIGVLEKTHASLKKASKIGTGEWRSLWRKYVNIALLNYNTSNPTSIRGEASRVFRGRVPYNVRDLKMGSNPQKQSTPNFQVAQDLLDQIDMILQNVRRDAMPAYTKFKAYYDKKESTSKLRERNYVSVLHFEAGHQGSKIPFTDFRWIGPCIFRTALPNNNYLVLTFWTDKTQILHRMPQPPSTPKWFIPDEQTTPQEWKPDSKVIPSPSINMDGQLNLTRRMSKRLGTTREGSPDIFLLTDGFCDGTVTYRYMEPNEFGTT